MLYEGITLESQNINQNAEGDIAVDEFVKQLANNIIYKLDNLEEETNLNALMDLPDGDLKHEAVRLKDEISQLKTYLKNLQ